jgi:uncharacterized protein YndB with AHSA1/START domain
MKTIKTTDLTLERTVHASPDQVFDVWIDPASPGGPWYGGTRAYFQPPQAVVDGMFYSLVEHAGSRWPHFGRFVVVDRPGKLTYTWMSPATQGLETTVEMTFVANDDKTVVTLKHLGVPDDEMGRQHADGWGFILDSIAQVMAKR